VCKGCWNLESKWKSGRKEGNAANPRKTEKYKKKKLTYAHVV
jgi:hypothetical protein